MNKIDHSGAVKKRLDMMGNDPKFWVFTFCIKESRQFFLYLNAVRAGRKYDETRNVVPSCGQIKFIGIPSRGQ